jgi:hypothetical protein
MASVVHTLYATGGIPMRTFAALAVAAMLTGLAAAQDNKGTVVEFGGMKSTTPADWKEEQPTSTMRAYQFKLPRAEGDPEDAELALFFFRNFSGSVDDNLKRQTAKFEPSAGKDKVEEKVDKQFKVGPLNAIYQDVRGVYLSKFPPFAPNAKITRKENYRQLYVVFENKDGQYYMTLLGPEKTVEKHKKGFDEWLRNFK